MRRIHVALAVPDFSAALRDYTALLSDTPCCVVDGTYALWRTREVNLSVTAVPSQNGMLRHLGFEDSEAEQPSEATDSSGIVWERFSEPQQRAEILARWPHAKFRDEG